jgi:hypothetical protein
MAAFGDLLAIVVIGFVIVAGLSLFTIGAPATPSFARRPGYISQCPASAGPECGVHL